MFPKFFCFLFLLTTCNSTAELPNQSSNANDVPSRRQLLRKLHDLGEIFLITPELAVYDDLGKNMTSAGRGIAINYSNQEEWLGKNLDDKAIFLIGSVEQHKLIQQMLPQLPFRWESNAIIFAEQKFSNPQSILKISLFPNPNNPQIPIFLLTGKDDKQIATFIQEKYKNNWRHFIWSSFGYQFFEKNTCTLAGFFSKEDWTMDKKLHWEFDLSEKDTINTPHFNFVSHKKIVDADQIKTIAKNCEATCEKIKNFFGKSLPSKLEYHIYPDMETKGLMIANTAQSHIVASRNEVHTVHTAAFQDNYVQLENQLIIQSIAGEAASPWMLNGLGIRFAPKWQRHGYKHWAKKLFSSDNLPPIQELLDPKLKGFESPIVLGAGQAALVDYLIAIWGKEKFIQQYKSWQPTAVELNALQPDFEKHLRNYSLKKVTVKKQRLSYLKGFNFAHEGYQIYNGYGSQLAKASLEKVQTLGTNAIALVPYSYMNDHTSPMPIPIVDGPGTETDEAVVHSLQHAKDLGMHTMLKPQLWLGRSWTGFIDMKNQEDWDAFFNHYYRWIKHFALLAEIYEVDIFSVGVEFVNATLKNEAVWKKMFERIRPLYSGQLTYCANWGDEFEKIDFWESLDFIGLNCYYPIGKNASEKPKVLQENFAGVVQKIERIAKAKNKKIVFTEIGFRSVAAPWKNPHAEADGRPFNEDHQAACYRAVLENIADKEWCAGILWWKWPCYLGHRGPENSSFAPAGKKTEVVIEEFFKKQ